MEENKNEFNNPEEISENKSKIDFSAIQSIPAPEIEDPAPSVAAVEVAQAADIEIKPISELETEEEAVIENPAEESAPAQGVCIIDETSTTILFEEGPSLTVDEILPTKKTAKEAAKEKIAAQKLKFSVVHIVIMAIVGLIALWSVFFTVDHTLAAQGISPIFCVETAQYKDGSVSYTGAGYKVQLTFDSKGNISQKVVPIWKQGPNDISNAGESE